MFNKTRHASPRKRTRAGCFLRGASPMKYAKPALSLDEQIDQLARRGMHIPDRESATHTLRHINYYRLRAYWLPFEIPSEVGGDHTFRPGTAFPDAVALYAFDRRLRLLVMDAIDRFEVSLRTRWAHVLAMRHGPHCYLDVNLFRRPREHEKWMYPSTGGIR